MDSGGPVSDTGMRHATHWTGREALFVSHGLGAPLSAGFFDPCSGRWDAVSSMGAPRPAASVAFIGGSLFAWSMDVVPAAARYDRAARRWWPSTLPIAAAQAPAIGSRVVLLAGEATTHPTGTIVDVAPGETLSETPIGVEGAPAGRVLAAVIAAPEAGGLFVFGGRRRDDATPFGDGATLDVVSGRWTPLPDENAPSPRFAAAALESAGEVVVWGGRDDAPLSDGARYRFADRRWIAMRGEDAPVWNERGVHALTPRFFVVLAERGGARYDLVRERWSRFALPTEMVAPWTLAHPLSDGTVLFSARDGSWFWRLDPRDGKWTSIPLGDDPREAPAVVVGGDHLFLWGGRAPSPAVDARCGEGATATCVPTAPAARHRAPGSFQRLLGR